MDVPFANVSWWTLKIPRCHCDESMNYGQNPDQMPNSCSNLEGAMHQRQSCAPSIWCYTQSCAAYKRTHTTAYKHHFNIALYLIHCTSKSRQQHVHWSPFSGLYPNFRSTLKDPTHQRTIIHPLPSAGISRDKQLCTVPCFSTLLRMWSTSLTSRIKGRPIL